ncbi:MAG: class I SAM-dependent methyltransferase [Gammaproteobacteria bacterium]|nr:class I SAM-dependent methyltransferase [Gammaproteobacteria bacterium]
MKSEEKAIIEEESVQSHPFVFEVNNELAIPDYLNETYWWAYIHPKGVRFFDSTFMVNIILFGNYTKLRDTIVNNLDENSGDILQIAAVYGNLSLKIAKKITDKNRLDVVDVATIQLQNLSRKVTGYNNVRLLHQDAINLNLEPESYEMVMIFFLLHEVPDHMKTEILEQALKISKPGGQIVLVDYHKPKSWSPFRYLMIPILSWVEPFAMSLWKRELASWLPEGTKVKKITKETFFTGLYQKVVIDL